MESDLRRAEKDHVEFTSRTAGHVAIDNEEKAVSASVPDKESIMSSVKHLSPVKKEDHIAQSSADIKVSLS